MLPIVAPKSWFLHSDFLSEARDALHDGVPDIGWCEYGIFLDLFHHDSERPRKLLEEGEMLFCPFYRREGNQLLCIDGNTIEVPADVEQRPMEDPEWGPWARHGFDGVMGYVISMPHDHCHIRGGYYGRVLVKDDRGVRDLDFCGIVDAPMSEHLRRYMASGEKATRVTMPVLHRRIRGKKTTK